MYLDTFRKFYVSNFFKFTKYTIKQCTDHQTEGIGFSRIKSFNFQFFQNLKRLHSSSGCPWLKQRINASMPLCWQKLRFYFLGKSVKKGCICYLYVSTCICFKMFRVQGLAWVYGHKKWHPVKNWRKKSVFQRGSNQW